MAKKAQSGQIPGLQPKQPLQDNRPSTLKGADVKALATWLVFPDQLNGSRFNGFQNRDNESLLKGSFVVGQNVVFNGDFQPAIRPGYSPLGTQATDSNAIQRAWVYETREGLVYELKQDAGGTIWYWLRGTSTDWSILLTGQTAGASWDFANIGKTSEPTNQVFFNNGIDSFYTFNGANATILLAGANTLKRTGGLKWTDAFFLVATNKIQINGITYTYTGGEGSDTLTGVTPDPNGVVLPGMLAVQAPQVVSALSSYKSNILFAHDGRLHDVLYAQRTTWDYSVLDNPYDFATTGAADGDAGSKEIELGGPLVAFANINQLILSFKNRLIKSLQFQQFGTRVDVPFYQTLTTTDDRSTTLGTISNKSICSTPKGLVFITPDKRLVLLTGVTANNEPQYIVLSDPIQPIFNAGIFDTCALVCADNVVWLAYASEKGVGFNDTVIRCDLTRQTTMPDGKIVPCMWDAPIVGWQVGDWTVIYNPTTGKNDVHWHSALNSGSYQVIQDPVDNTGAFTATIRTWAETFGYPHLQKRIDQIFIEVKMSENTNLLMTLLYNENGITSTYEAILDGDSTSNKFNNIRYNPFGAYSFGSQKFGSNPSLENEPTYRFVFKTNRIPPFFNISLQLSSDEQGQNWSLTRFGYRLAEVLPEPDSFVLWRPGPSPTA